MPPRFLGPPIRDLTPALTELVAAVPALQWACVVQAPGQLLGTYPAQPAVVEERQVAMSLALASLGARITQELESGAWQINLISGTTHWHLAATLGANRVLLCALRPQAILEDTLHQLRQALPAVLQALNQAPPAWLQS